MLSTDIFLRSSTVWLKFERTFRPRSWWIRGTRVVPIPWCVHISSPLTHMVYLLAFLSYIVRSFSFRFAHQRLKTHLTSSTCHCHWSRAPLYLEARNIMAQNKLCLECNVTPNTTLSIRLDKWQQRAQWTGRCEYFVQGYYAMIRLHRQGLKPRMFGPPDHEPSTLHTKPMRHKRNEIQQLTFSALIRCELRQCANG